MGTGHVMRCLTLANALARKGATVEFICREHPGNLIGKIQQEGFRVHALDAGAGDHTVTEPCLAHAEWLGVSQEQDAKACQSILSQANPDWLIVDHYAIDRVWQSELKPFYKKLMVIDDLADRHHLCNLLLDQNYGATIEKYKNLTPKNCQLLMGTKYALLRPEFAQWRDCSLKRRSRTKKVGIILITLGGIDPDNYTGQMLSQIAHMALDRSIEIVVVMGQNAPHLESIKMQADKMPVETTVKVNVANMAELMAKADLAIGASGATTWERCCLGLPTIQLVLADNQHQAAAALAKAGIIKLAKDASAVPQHVMRANEWLQELSLKAAALCDGGGTKRVCEALV